MGKYCERLNEEEEEEEENIIFIKNQRNQNSMWKLKS